MTILRLFYLLLFLITGCSFTRVEPMALAPTATTLRVVQTTPVPTLERELHTVATDQPTAPQAETVLAVDEDSCQSTGAQPMTRHTINAVIDYPAHTAAVEQRIRYINRTNNALPQIVLNVEVNQRLGAFSLERVAVDETPVNYELTGRRLTVDLSEPLEPGCPLTLELSFRIVVPSIVAGSVSSHQGFLGYTPRQLNMGHWLPTVAVLVNGEWITREPAFVGEQTVLDQADWEVTLEVTGAAESLVVAGPGSVEQVGDHRWHYEHRGGRDFTLSLSEAFNVASQQTDDGITVEVYSFDDANVQLQSGPVDTAAFALEEATRSLSMYSDLFGEYPYERMVVVQGDFPDGMEFSGIMFVSGDWFRSYPGNPASYLLMITVHEVAHQWWYASVGSDSAMNPWMDEALATYSEYIYIEEYYPELKEWWWSFRVDRYQPSGFVDETVYEFTNIREYINTVYLRGVHMLHDLRDDLGTEAFFDWLRRYAEVGAGRVATPALMWSLLSQEQQEATRDTRIRYLQNGGL